MGKWAVKVSTISGEFLFGVTAIDTARQAKTNNMYCDYMGKYTGAYLIDHKMRLQETMELGQTCMIK